MTKYRKLLLVVLGILSALAITCQLVLGQLILGGNTQLVKAHQHSGYTTVVLALIYIMVSLTTIFSLPIESESKAS